MLKPFLVSLIFLGASLVFGQVDEVKSYTKALCSPEMHGRGYVNGGDSIAAEFLAEKFEAVGIQKIPGKHAYFQGFRFPVNTFPGEMEVSINDQELKPGVDFIVKPNSGGYTGTLPMIFVTKEDFADAKRLGKIYDSIRFGVAAEDSDNSEVKSGASFAVVTSLDELTGDTLKIAEQFINSTAEHAPVIQLYSKKFTWSVGRSATNYPFIQMRDSLWEAGAVTFNIDQQFKESHYARNVIGYLPAAAPTSKTIFFTAHYDHLGRMGKDIYFPGANDNASGTAMLLTLGKYFKANPSKYNIVFIAFAGEEAGLIGSRHFVEHPWVNLGDISFVLNLDIMGSGEEGITVVNATLFPKAFKKLQKLNKKHDLLAQVKSRGPAANSDHYFFTQAGVPAFFIYTMGPNKHYHDVFDTHEELSFAEYEDITTLLRLFLEKF